MICNRLNQGWEIIYQRAHALLAAKLLVPLDHNDRNGRWFETLNAVAQHDHGWQEWQSMSPLTSTGEPRNFLDTPPKESERQGRLAVECALHQSLWGGLLVAHHVASLYEDTDEGCLQRLLVELAVARADWRAKLGIDIEEEEEAYQFLSWADTLSLMLCLQPPERLGPTHPRLRGTSYTLQGSGPTRQLQPWPYSEEAITVSVEAHHLKQDRFSSPEDLIRALSASEVVTKTWRLQPGNGEKL